MDAFRLLACFVFRDFCSVSPFRLYEEVPGLDFEFEQQSLKAKSASNLKHAHSLEWNNNTITKGFPSTFRNTLRIVAEHNATPANQRGTRHLPIQ